MSKPAPQFYTSHLSRFCAEQLPGDFHFLDGDEVLLRYSAQPIHYARETNVLRICESKMPGEDLRRSQREVLPILAEALFALVKHGRLATGSGVFVIEGEPPWVAGADVRQVLPQSENRAVGLQTLGPRTMAASDLAEFLRCRGPFMEAA